MKMTIRPLHARRILSLLALAVLAGCAVQTPQMPIPQPRPQPQPPGQVTPLPPGQPPQVSRPVEPARPARPVPPRSPEEISSPAVMALLDRVDKLMRAENAADAAATLQRALNIEPRNPFLYQRLAAVRLAQGRPGQAEALAHKSNSLAVGNPFVQGDNWALIAHARRMAGNETGWRAARSKVEQYRLRSAALQ